MSRKESAASAASWRHRSAAGRFPRAAGEPHCRARAASASPTRRRASASVSSATA